MAKSKKPDNRLASFISNNMELLGWIAAGSLVVIFHNFSLHLSVWIASGEAGKWLSQAALSLQDFLTLTLSVIVEAVPFLILGTIISALIRCFLPVAGFLIEKEVKFLGQALERPRKPFIAIMGDAKMGDKMRRKTLFPASRKYPAGWY